MENESSTTLLRQKLGELSRVYSKDKHVQPRSRSANNRQSITDLNASFRYRRMRRKMDALRTQIDTVLHDKYLTVMNADNLSNDLIPTRDDDDQNLVTNELIHVLNSKQMKIDELEERLKQLEEQESQWKLKYERESNRCELLQRKIIELEQKLSNQNYQSNHSTFDNSEVENDQLNTELLLARNTHLLSQLDKFRYELAHTCHESLC